MKNMKVTKETKLTHTGFYRTLTEYAPGEPELVAYKLTSTTKDDISGTDCNPYSLKGFNKSVEGICRLTDFQAFFRSGQQSAPSEAIFKIEDVPDPVGVRGVLPGWREAFAKYGIRPNTEHPLMKDAPKVWVEKPYTALTKGQPFDVILVNHIGAWAFEPGFRGPTLPKDRVKSVPEMITLGWIDHQLTNRHYKLKKLRDILLARDDVRIIPGGGEDYGWRNRDYSKEVPVEDLIGLIPSYNSEGNEDRCLEFLWYPNPEDWEKAYEHAFSSSRVNKSDKGKIANSVFELNLLGTEAARKNGKKK